MNSENVLKNYITKVSRILTVVLASGFFSTFSLTYLKVFSSYVPTFIILFGTILSGIFIFIKKQENISMYVLLISAYVAFFLLAIDAPQYTIAFAMVMFSLSAVFFNKLVIIINWISMSGVLVYYYFVENGILLQDLIVQASNILFSAIALLLLARWGMELIHTAGEKTQNSNMLLGQLEKTMDATKTNTSSLYNDISKCNDNLGIVHNISSSMATTI